MGGSVASMHWGATVTPMDGEEGTARRLELAHEGERVVKVVEESNLAKEGHTQPAGEGGNDLEQQLAVDGVAEEGTKVAAVRGALWAAEVKVDGNDAADPLGLVRYVEQLLRVIPGKVRDEWGVVGVLLEQVDARAGLGELLAANHGRVAQVCAVAPREQPEGQLATAHHWRQDELVRRQWLARGRQ